MRKLIAALFCCWLTPGMAQTIPLYEHFGTAVYRIDKPDRSPPAIDATAFANYGIFVITNVVDFDLAPVYAPGVGWDGSTDPNSFNYFSLAYEPVNLRYFTNRNYLQAFVGFRFSDASEFGRRPMGTFLNDNGSVVDAVGVLVDEGFLDGTSTNFIRSQQVRHLNSYVDVWATNVINRGTISTDNQGIIRIRGENVDLTRGAVQVRTIQTPLDEAYEGNVCFFGGDRMWNGGVTNYIPTPGLSDYLWGSPPYDNNFASPLALLYFRTANGYATLTPSFDAAVMAPPQYLVRTNLFLENPVTAVYRQALDPQTRPEPTNVIIQAVFVKNADPAVGVNISFSSSTIATNPWLTPSIEFSATQPDPVTGGTLQNHLYLSDLLMSQPTNNVLQRNLRTTRYPTFCPGNFIVSRIAPCEFLQGVGGNTQAVPSLFYNQYYSNRVVTNIQTAYGLIITNAILTVPEFQSLTNSISRVEVTADNLKMDRTRISSEGYVGITAKHLVSSTNASIQVGNLDLNLGSTNGNLLVRDLVRDNVTKFAGGVFAYSQSWTNYSGYIVTNILNPGTPEETNEMVTNIVTILFHALVVDSRLQTRFPMTILGLRTTSTNVTIGDNLLVTDALDVDATSLTVAASGSLRVSNPLNSWRGTNFPNLVQLTNLGSIIVTNFATLGTDRDQPFQAIVNKGFLQSSGFRVRASNFENSGTFSSVQVATNLLGSITNFGPMEIEATLAKLDGGVIDCGLDLRLRAGDVKFREHSTSVRGTLFMAATNSLSDNGPGSNNSIGVRGGFHLEGKPATGDLLGTTLLTFAPAFYAVDHSWSAEDRGAVAAGFSNNLAIGRLIISAGANSFMSFAGDQPGRAIYADFLELRGDAVSIEAALSIAPNMTIYFADATLPPEELDGRLGGRLRWVSEFAGPNSSVDVPVTANTVRRMNRGLRFSTSADSDGDGIANAFDDAPLTPGIIPGSGAFALTVVATNLPPVRPIIAWAAFPLSVSQLESSPNLRPGSWETLAKFTNTILENVRIEHLDRRDQPGVRYYRVRQSQ